MIQIYYISLSFLDNEIFNWENALCFEDVMFMLCVYYSTLLCKAL